MDGTLVPQSLLPNYANWGISDTILLPGSIQVIAVSLQNNPQDAGFLASTADEWLITNDTWKCITRGLITDNNWMNTDYDDSFWPNAFLQSTNYGGSRNYDITTISSKAYWIWTYFTNVPLYYDKYIYCRVRL